MGLILWVLLFMILTMALFYWLRNRKWTLHFTAFGYENYFKIVAQLKKEGIKYKVRTPVGAIRNPSFGERDNTQYDIYILKESEGQGAKTHIN